MPNIMLAQSIKAYFLGVRNISSQSYRDNWEDNQQFGGSFQATAFSVNCSSRSVTVRQYWT